MKISKKLLKKAFKKIGVERINNYLKTQGIKYELAKKGANYYYYYWHKANKKIDLKNISPFWDIAKTIIESKKTSLYFDRLYTLWQAVSNIAFSSSPIAEIGTFRGGSAKFMLEAIKAHNQNNRLFVFDTFTGHVAVDKTLDGKHELGLFSDTSYEEVKNYLSAPNVVVHKGDFRETCKDIEHLTNFELVHIDVDVYPVTNFCLEFFKNRVTPGGTIIVDDYGNLNCKGLKLAVDNFVTTNNNFTLFYLLTGQALLTKVNEVNNFV